MKKQTIFYILLICTLLFTLPIYATDIPDTTDPSDTTDTSDTPGTSDATDTEEEEEEETTFSDFSNATITTTAQETENSTTHVYRTVLNITGIAGYDEDSTYMVGLSHDSNPDISELYFDTTVRTTTNGNLSFQLPILAKYFEEAGDVYLWVLETKGLESSLVLEGYRLSRVDLPSLGKRIYAAFSDRQTIVYMYTDHNTSNERTVSYKIGLVNDSSIINKFKNNNSTATTSLLQYAKTATAVKRGTADLLESESITESFSIVDGAYYYVYLELEDENGTYYPVEDVWLYQGSNSSLGKLLYRYGSDEFYWVEEEEPTKPDDDEEPKQPPKDDTTIKGELPQTGIDTVIYVLIAILIVLSVVSYIQYKRYKDIKK